MWMSHKVCHQPRALRMVCANRSKAVSIERHACAAQKWFSRLYKTASQHNDGGDTQQNTVCWLRNSHFWHMRDLVTCLEVQLKLLMWRVLVRVARASGDVGLTYGMWRKCMWRWTDCVASGKPNGRMAYSTQRFCWGRSPSPPCHIWRESQRLCWNRVLEYGAPTMVEAARL